MKVGDKLICKKYLNSYGLILKPGKSYQTLMISTDAVFIVYADSGLWFNINKSGFKLDLYDYFYTQEELRLKKLESL